MKMKDVLEVGVKVNGPRWVAALFWSQVLWRAGLAALLIGAAWQVWHLPATVGTIVAREGDQTRTAAKEAVADNLKPVLAEVKGWREDTGKQMDKLRDAVLGPEDSLKADVMARVDAIEGALVGPEASLKTDLLARADKLTEAVLGPKDSLKTDLLARVDKLDPLLADVKNVTGAASEQADLLGRCGIEDPLTGDVIGGNQDCLANRLIPAMKNFEHMAAAGEKVFNAVAAEAQPTAKAVREGAQQVTGIATDVHTVTTAMTAPVPWYKKLGNFVYNVAELAARWF